MLPILIKIGPLTLRTYGLMYATGVMLGILLSLKLARRENINTDRYLDFIFFTAVVGIIGAKLFLLLTNLGYYLRYPSELKSIIFSGGTFFGGLVFALPFAAWFIRRKNFSFRAAGDVTMPGLALGHFFGRIGCFAAGCCFGRAAFNFPLSITFHNEQAHTLSGTPLSVPLYPTQLAEAILNLLNFAFLLWLFPRRRFKGQVLVFYLMNYSIIRFFVEYFRGDSDRGFIFGGPGRPFSSLSLPQLISICSFILAFVLYLAFRKKGEQENLPQGR